ncbi:MAG: S8 family peptidase [Chitinophagaceae bacterium]|nr:S8 family peptidase [Chitinophagaceae bacterium]
MPKIVITALLLIFFNPANAQLTRYIVSLKNKAFNEYTLANPIAYLSQRAIDRRNRYNIAIDSLDLPVTGRYIDSIRNAGSVTIINTSKWLNQVAIKTSDAVALAKINAYPFVMNVTAIASLSMANEPTENDKFFLENNTGKLIGTGDNVPTSSLNGIYDYGLSGPQVTIHNNHFLHNMGFSGQGMQLAMMDAGFFHYQTLPTFDSIRLNNQILGTWDFVANEASVNEDYYHGMQCLSTIAANMPGSFVGQAPKANFYLFRTEDVASEYPIEEQNWAAAAEYADSLGVDVTSTSLGYYSFDDASLNYTYNDMDGNTTISAKAADIAAKKGMLCVVAAGNEGTNSWHYLITPSDADSVLAVGAVNANGDAASFSSYGPSSDGQIKPGVAAVGWMAVVANTSNGAPQFGNGTSFACPNMAGVSTCLWQAFPEVNNMAIIVALQKSASKYTTADDRVGYGIPDVKKAFALLIKKLYTQNAMVTNCGTSIELKVKTCNYISIVAQRRLNNETVYTTIDSLPQAGNFSLKTIAINDNLQGQAEGIVWYRFKLAVDADTSFYLDSVAVTIPSCNINGNSIVVGPNPVATDLSIKVTQLNAVKLQFVLHNSAGQNVYTQTVSQAANTFMEYKIPFNRLSRGIYFVSVFKNDKKILSKKILY